MVIRFALTCTLIGLTGPIDLPPEFKRLADLLCDQPGGVSDLFHFVLVLAMIGDEKAHSTGTRMNGDREYLMVRTIAGEVFEITRPPISERVSDTIDGAAEGDHRG